MDLPEHNYYALIPLVPQAPRRCSMNIAKQLLTTLLIVVGAAAFVLQSGCSYSGYSVRPEARHHSLAKAAADLNQVADPNLPSRTYTNCTAGEWEMKVNTDSESGTSFGGYASQRCAPVDTRGSGYYPNQKTGAK